MCDWDTPQHISDNFPFLMSSSPHLFAGILTKAFPLLLNQTPWPSLYTRTASNCCFHTYLFCGEMLESLKVLHQGHRSCEQGFRAALFSPTRPTLLMLKALSIFLFPVASLVPAEPGSSSFRGSVGKCLGRDEQRWKGVLQFKEGINGFFRGLWKQAASWHSYVIWNAFTCGREHIQVMGYGEYLVKIIL